MSLWWPRKRVSVIGLTDGPAYRFNTSGSTSLKLLVIESSLEHTVPLFGHLPKHYCEQHAMLDPAT